MLSQSLKPHNEYKYLLSLLFCVGTCGEYIRVSPNASTGSLSFRANQIASIEDVLTQALTPSTFSFSSSPPSAPQWVVCTWIIEASPGGTAGTAGTDGNVENDSDLPAAGTPWAVHVELLGVQTALQDLGTGLCNTTHLKILDQPSSVAVCSLRC